jgi:hypothetical protein
VVLKIVSITLHSDKVEQAFVATRAQSPCRKPFIICIKLHVFLKLSSLAKYVPPVISELSGSFKINFLAASMKAEVTCTTSS